MTGRLYYTAPYRRSFDAKVLTVEDASGHSLVTLDQTAFYPTSGGQPFDTGTLGGAAVTDVIDRDDGTVAHVVSGALKPGDVVAGEIDWARRFDHMQQHTGQHVLSAAFDRLFAARTESFHLGDTTATIDLGARGHAPKSRRPKTTPTASSGRIARSRSDSQPPKRRRYGNAERIRERGPATHRRSDYDPVDAAARTSSGPAPSA